MGRGKIFETNIDMDYLWVNVIFVGLDLSSDRIRAARTPHSVPGITRCIISCKEVSAAAAAPFPSTFTNLIILAQAEPEQQQAGCYTTADVLTPRRRVKKLAGKGMVLICLSGNLGIVFQQ